MLNCVLLVQRDKTSDYRVVAARLPAEELEAIGAAALKTLIESGADLHNVLELLNITSAKNLYSCEEPFVVLGGGE